MEEFGWKYGGKTANLQAFISTAESLNIAGMPRLLNNLTRDYSLIVL